MAKRLDLTTRAIGSLALRLPLGLYLLIAGGTKLFTYRAAPEDVGDQQKVGLSGFLHSYRWLLPPDPDAPRSTLMPGERRVAEGFAEAMGTDDDTPAAEPPPLSRQPADQSSWLPYPVARGLLIAVPFVEFFTGIFILVGLMTRISAVLGGISLAILFALIGGLWGSHQEMPFNPRLVLPAMALALAMFGGGPLSLDWLVWHWRHRPRVEPQKLPASVKL